MKKTLLAASVAAVLAVPAASAYDLTINGEAVAGFEGATLNFDGDTLDLTADNYTFVNSGNNDDDSGNDDGDSGNDDGDSGNDDDDSGNDDDDSGNDDDDSGNDDDDSGNGTDLCASPPSGVVCQYEISASDWASPGTEDARLNIPKGKILASKLQTSSSSLNYGRISFWTPVGAKARTVDIWISETPGGDPLSDRCFSDGNSLNYALPWTQFPYTKFCTLEPSTDYFMNIKHSDSDTPSSTIVRDTLTSTRK